VSRIPTRIAAVAGLALAASGVALMPSSAAPAGPAGVAPATGASSTKSTFETGLVCKASDTVSVLVSGGTGTGASVPPPGREIVAPVPVASVATPGGGMSIPSSQTWAQWAAAGSDKLTRLDGRYTVTVKCTNGEDFVGAVDFTGTDVAGATYRFVAPQPTTATATQTTTQTATATKTATATTTAPEKPIPIPSKPPTASGVLAVNGEAIVGGVITVTGEGFRPGSPITVGIYPGAKELASAVADGSGKAVTQLTLPEDSAGKAELVMLGYAPDGKERVLNASVEVIKAPVITIPPQLPKSDGVLVVSGEPVPGGTVTVSGTGFKPGSPVAVGIYSNGKALTTTVANGSGEASTAVVIPTDYLGQHTLAMVGADPKDAVRTLTAPITIAEPATGTPWWVWLLVALGVIIIIAIIWAVAAGRKKQMTPWDKALATQAAAAAGIANGPALAISDRGRPAAEAITLWNTDLPSMQTTEAQINQLVQTAPDDKRRGMAQQLLGATVALREALNGDVQLRANESAPGQDALLAQSAGVVAQRRQELANVVATIPALPAAAPAHR